MCSSDGMYVVALFVACSCCLLNAYNSWDWTHYRRVFLSKAGLFSVYLLACAVEQKHSKPLDPIV
jgi:hypothetical protein